jgi:endo-1,4-beta-mannosidase
LKHIAPLWLCGYPICSAPLLQESISLQTSPGVHNEEAMEALDWVLHTAAKYGLRVVITLTDNWRVKDGKKQV